jgi:hypothetical protein
MNPTARDEAVRRLRDASARRIEKRGRFRAFSSWCALATLAGGISLAALEAHDAQTRTSQAEEAARQVAVTRQRLLDERDWARARKVQDAPR